MCCQIVARHMCSTLIKLKPHVAFGYAGGTLLGVISETRAKLNVYVWLCHREVPKELCKPHVAFGYAGGTLLGVISETRAKLNVYVWLCHREVPKERSVETEGSEPSSANGY